MPSVVTVGIAVIATLMMLSVYSWIAIWAFGRINPPASTELGFVFASDYLTTMRVILALIVAALASAITWAIGEQLAE